MRLTRAIDASATAHRTPTGETHRTTRNSRAERPRPAAGGDRWHRGEVVDAAPSAAASVTAALEAAYNVAVMEAICNIAGMEAVCIVAAMESVRNLAPARAACVRRGPARGAFSGTEADDCR